MTPTTPTTPDTGLTQDLIDRVLKLSGEDWERLVDLVDEAHGPPDTRTDEEIAAMIKERSDEYHAGRGEYLTREESDALIRAKMRELGFELPSYSGHRQGSSMMPTADAGLTPDLMDQVTKLSEAGRVRLLDILLHGPEDDPETVRREHRDEIARRIADIEAGRVQLLDAEEALDRAEQRLREKYRP